MNPITWEDEQGFRWTVDPNTQIPCPSVTSVLSRSFTLDDNSWYELPHEIRQKILNAAADTGNTVHDFVHDLIQGENPVIPGIWLKPFDKFKEFLEKKQPVRMASEQLMIHPSYHYAGSADEIVKTNEGSIELWDIKSGIKRIKHAQQVAAYKLLAETQGYKIDKIALIYINIKELWFEVSYIKNVESCEREFLCKLDSFKFDNHSILRGLRTAGGICDPKGNLYKWPTEEVFKRAYDDYMKGYKNGNIQEKQG